MQVQSLHGQVQSLHGQVQSLHRQVHALHRQVHAAGCSGTQRDAAARNGLQEPSSIAFASRLPMCCTRSAGRHMRRAGRYVQQGAAGCSGMQRDATGCNAPDVRPTCAMCAALAHMCAPLALRSIAWRAPCITWRGSAVDHSKVLDMSPLLAWISVDQRGSLTWQGNFPEFGNGG